MEHADDLHCTRGGAHVPRPTHAKPMGMPQQCEPRAAASLDDRHALHDDGRLRSVARPRGDTLDGLHDLETLDDLSENGVLGGRRAVKVVEECVGVRVDEELRAARVGLARVGHRFFFFNSDCITCSNKFYI